MTENKLPLEKNRDFGELFNDTFLFIKYNFKNLLMGMIYFVVPFALLQGIAQGIVQHQALTSLSLGQAPSVFGASTINNLLITYLFLFITYTFTIAFIFQYMKLYKVSTDKVIELKNVWKLMLGVTPKIFLSIISMAILSGIGFIFLIIPGIYLMVCFSLVLPIIIFQEDSLGGAISSCFSLIKNNWWKTFGFLIILGLIASALSFVFQLPALIYQVITTIHVAQNETSQVTESLSILFSIIQAIGTSLLQLLPFTGIGILYFSLVEQKENPALLKELESVGANE